MPDFTKRLKDLQTQISKAKLHGFIVPLADEFQNEYPPAYARRLEWLTGFTGSSGVAVILKEKAAFFTDGRYTLQAQKQLNSKDYEIHNIGDKTPWRWASEHLARTDKLGFDPWLHTYNNIQNYSQANCIVEATSKNLVDVIWENKPVPKFADVRMHSLEYAGERTNKKIRSIATELKNKKTDACIITAPDSICWLLNIRGSDIPHTPFVLAYAIIYKNGTVKLFIDSNRINRDVGDHLGKEVEITPPGALEEYLAKLKGKNVSMDPSSISFWFFEKTKGSKIIWEEDACQIPKACKNKIELYGFKNAHTRDGAALTKFLYWLEQHVRSGQITEIDASQKLLEIRREHEMFIEPSFDTIAGFADNGAIIHYHPRKETNRALQGNGLFLLDSGGQYPDGTTDVTRTIAIGTPSPEQMKNFTLVLKGHIALAQCLFPKGTTGSALDAFARQYLWKAGLDYDHGTGHGVGSYLSVHEGPQSISKRANNIALRPGMILSNEPGYYKIGEYGIRIENLVAVVQMPNLGKEGREFYGFKTLTKAPIDLRLVDFSILTENEKDWLETYHSYVVEDLTPLLHEDELNWLELRVRFPEEEGQYSKKDYDW